MRAGRPSAGDDGLRPAAFTPSHRGGDGPPLVLLHGFLDTWRVRELVLLTPERCHDVLALTLAGHARRATVRRRGAAWASTAPRP